MSETKPEVENAPSELQKVVGKYRSVGAAVKANDVAAFKVLREHLKEGADTEMFDALLWRGAPSLSPEMAAEIVAAGANPRMLHFVPQTTDQINTGTHAARTGNTELLGWLIKEGHLSVTDMDAAGNTYFTAAVACGQLATAARLLELGTDINARNFYEETAFHTAASQYQVEAMVWLVERGADPTLEASDGADVPMCVPEFVEGHAGTQWHPDVIHRFLNEYAQAYAAARQAGLPPPSMTVPEDVQAEVALEKGPQQVPPATDPSEDVAARASSRLKM